MSMTIDGIKTSVQTLLEGLNTPDQTFVTILAAPPAKESDFAGYPSACHYYASAESNFATVSQNRRVIEYVVELYIVANEDTPEADLWTEAYALTDKVMDMFDHSIDLNNACQLMRPTPSVLDPIETKEGRGLMMTIRLFCEDDITFRNM